MHNKPINVLIVEDHRLVRHGMVSLLKENEGIEIAGEAQDGQEMMAIIRRQPVDIILMDINLPGASGLDLTRKLRSHPDTAHIGILILSMFTQEEFILDAVKAGAKGYLPKNTSQIELLEAIRCVHQGKEYFSPLVSAAIFKGLMRQNDQTQTPVGPENLLSKREIEILTLFAQGLSNPEIADKLYISTRTVESHKNHIMQKLGIKNSVDLVKYAIKNKLIEI